MTDWTSKFSRRGAALKPSAIRQTAKYAAQPGVISFASGSPNPDLFPYDALNAAMTGLMADPKRRGEALQYGSSEGYKPLRELIAERARRDGARVAADNIVITNGSQQTLEFMAKLLVEPGDLVAVTSPTYLGAMQAFDLFQPNYADVTLNDDGVNLAALERAFAAGARFFYLTPDFGNPSGVTLPVEQRRAILKLARKHQTPIFEDQAYEHLWFGAEKLPSMLALDSEDGDPSLVIHAGTFSKSLAPGVRVGWIVAPKPMAEKLALMRQASDLQGASLNQMIVHDAAVAILDDHIVELRAAYRRRRDLMLRALARFMPQNVRWNEPAGGMFIWLALPEPLDATHVQSIAVEQESVVFVPGAPFFANGGGEGLMRLSFSTAPENLIEEGVARLARAIRTAMNASESQIAATSA